MRCALLGSALAALLALSGCVERLLQVRSDPPGAAVHVNGAEVGTTPLDYPFHFYGTFEVTLRQEGYFSHRELKAVSPPWYEVFPLDFFSELVVPWTVRDKHVIDVRLEPASRAVGDEEMHQLDEKVDELRAETEGTEARQGR